MTDGIHWETEVAPDSFAESGEFEIPDIAKQRRSESTKAYPMKRTAQKTKNVPVVLKASPKESLPTADGEQISPHIVFTIG